MRESLTAAVALLHDEAHGAYKTTFALCLQQACRDVRDLLDEHYAYCDEESHLGDYEPKVSFG